MSMGAMCWSSTYWRRSAFSAAKRPSIRKQGRPSGGACIQCVCKATKEASEPPLPKREVESWPGSPLVSSGGAGDARGQRLGCGSRAKSRSRRSSCFRRQAASHGGKLFFLRRKAQRADGVAFFCHRQALSCVARSRWAGACSAMPWPSRQLPCAPSAEACAGKPFCCGSRRRGWRAKLFARPLE